LEVYRAGMTMLRVEELDLSPSYDTEEKDISTKQAYLDLYDTADCYELEAMEPEDLRDALIEALAKLCQSTDCFVEAHTALAPALEGFSPTPGNAGDRRGAGADGAFGLRPAVRCRQAA
jgi:hypothetical protein